MIAGNPSMAQPQGRQWRVNQVGYSGPTVMKTFAFDHDQPEASAPPEELEQPKSSKPPLEGIGAVIANYLGHLASRFPPGAYLRDSVLSIRIQLSPQLAKLKDDAQPWPVYQDCLQKLELLEQHCGAAGMLWQQQTVAMLKRHLAYKLVMLVRDDLKESFCNQIYRDFKRPGDLVCQENQVGVDGGSGMASVGGQLAHTATQRISDTHALFFDKKWQIGLRGGLGWQKKCELGGGVQLGRTWMHGYDGHHHYAQVLAEDHLDQYVEKELPGLLDQPASELYKRAMAESEQLQRRLSRMEGGGVHLMVEPALAEKTYDINFNRTKAKVKGDLGKAELGAQVHVDQGEALKYFDLLDTLKGNNGLIYKKRVKHVLQGGVWQRLTDLDGKGFGSAAEVENCLRSLSMAMAMSGGKSETWDSLKSRQQMLQMRQRLEQAIESQAATMQSYYDVVNRLDSELAQRHKRAKKQRPFQLCVKRSQLVTELRRIKRSYEKELRAHHSAEYLRYMATCHAKLVKLHHQTGWALGLMVTGEDQVPVPGSANFEGVSADFSARLMELEEVYRRPRIVFSRQQIQKYLQITTVKKTYAKRFGWHFKLKLSALGLPTTLKVDYQRAHNKLCGVPDYEGRYSRLKITIMGHVPSDLYRQLGRLLVERLAEGAPHLKADPQLVDAIEAQVVSALGNVDFGGLKLEAGVQLNLSFTERLDQELRLNYCRIEGVKSLGIDAGAGTSMFGRLKVRLMKHHRTVLFERIGTGCLWYWLRKCSAARFWKREQILDDFHVQHQKQLRQILENLALRREPWDEYLEIREAFAKHFLVAGMTPREVREGQEVLDGFEKRLAELRKDPGETAYQAAMLAMRKLLFLHYDTVYSADKELLYRLRY